MLIDVMLKNDHVFQPIKLNEHTVIDAVLVIGIFDGINAYLRIFLNLILFLNTIYSGNQGFRRHFESVGA